MKDPYSVLGVARDASQDDIKSAYRKLSKEWHPDKHRGDKTAEEKFKEINEAYSVLSDAEKRKRYDQYGQAGMGGGPGGGGFDFSGFSQGMPDLDDLFGSFFGGAGRRQRAEESGEDLEVSVRLSLADVLTGAERTLSVRRLQQCETCSGTGAAEGKRITCDECGGTGSTVRQTSSFFGTIQQRVLCARCGGSGKVPETPCSDCSGEGRRRIDGDITVRIPAGVENGQTLRVSGGGNAGRRGTASGDLYVHVTVDPDKRFVRDGADIHTTLTLHPLHVLLGDEVDVETLHGVLKLKIPEGTQPGQVLRMKGKGLPTLQSSRPGNHDVHIEVEVPKKLSRAERKILEEWKAARG